MVQITPEEHFAMKRRQEEPDDPYEKILRLGETVRLEIPFRDVFRMRQTADLLRGFADMMDAWSRRADLPPRSVLFHIRSEARILNKKIRDTQGPGRPAKTYEND